MPIRALLEAMDPPPPADVLAAADGADATATSSPSRSSSRPKHGFPDNWIYIHDPDVKVGRIQNFGSWSPYIVKDGRTCLGLEYFVFEGDEMWNMADADLVELAKRELAQLGLVDPSRVEAGYVVRMPKAYPFYDATYKANVATLVEWLEANTPNVYPVGRNGMHTLQQPGPLDVHGDAHGREHLRRAPRRLVVNVEAEYHEEKA